jgi:hypothetical protein
MYTIENYLKPKLSKISSSLFEKRQKKNKLLKTIDEVMKGELMATEAEQEMIEKKIDNVAAGIVNDFFTNIDKPESITESACWS